MNRRTGTALAVALVLATSAWACSSTSTPVTPTPVEKKTETYSSTLPLGGSQEYSFAATTSGVVTATVKSLEPDNTVTIGVAVGTWNGLSCSDVAVDQTAKLNSVVVGLATAAVSLCVRVFDVGGFKEATTYTVTVDHY